VVDSDSEYVPDRGDVVWLDFNPKQGHEQAGKRPALVLSPALYNGKIGLMVCCPITSQIKGYPFEVLIQAQTINGAVLSDQVKSLDWRARNADYAAVAAGTVMKEVSAKIVALIRDVR